MALKKLSFAVVTAGDILWCPPGAVVVETTHQGLLGWGVRVSCLIEEGEKALQAAVQHFDAMKRPAGHLKILIAAIQRFRKPASDSAGDSSAGAAARPGQAA